MTTHRAKALHYPIKFGFPQKGQCRGSSHPLKMGEFPPRQRIYMKNLIVTRGGMVVWSSMLLWILTALIVYLAVGKDWILAVDIF